MAESTVYLAVTQERDTLGDGWILGIYYTREKAQARIEQGKRGNPYMEFRIEETEVGLDRWPGL